MLDHAPWPPDTGFSAVIDLACAPLHQLSNRQHRPMRVHSMKKSSCLPASRLLSAAAATAFVALTSQGAMAQKVYDTGASDTEIKIGNIEAYSGPASAYGMIGKTEEAFFKMINDRGGGN